MQLEVTCSTAVVSNRTGTGPAVLEHSSVQIRGKFSEHLQVDYLSTTASNQLLV
jgi:hypothetical protein